jgi:hypothetical protein
LLIYNKANLISPTGTYVNPPEKEGTAMETANATEKKPYTPPQLIEYGDIAEITRSGALQPNDGMPFGTRPEG